MSGSRRLRLCHQTCRSRTSLRRHARLDFASLRPHCYAHCFGSLSMSSPSRLANGVADAEGSREPTQRNDMTSREKMKILVVDDNPDNLVSIEAALDTLKEQVVTARSGTEALRYLLENDFAA